MEGGVQGIFVRFSRRSKFISLPLSSCLSLFGIFGATPFCGTKSKGPFFGWSESTSERNNIFQLFCGEATTLHALNEGLSFEPY